MMTFAPHLEVLPLAQRQVWDELGASLPESFVLYGGTAIALRTGSRQSEDFDFFTNDPVNPHTLGEALPFLSGARLVQAAPSTATFIVERQSPVKVSIFGDLSLGRVGEPSIAVPGGVRVASLLDLAAQKVRVVQVRAERKDYLDVMTLIGHGVPLERALGAAQALYSEFDPIVSLKALAYFGDGDLDTLPGSAKQALIAATREVRRINAVPVVAPRLD